MDLKITKMVEIIDIFTPRIPQNKVRRSKHLQQSDFMKKLSAIKKKVPMQVPEASA